VLHKNIMPLDVSLSLLVEVTSGITGGCSCAKLLMKSRNVQFIQMRIAVSSCISAT